MINAKIVYIGCSARLICILIALLIRYNNKNCDNFCLCDNIKGKNCTPYQTKIDNYNNGLNETQNMAAIQKKNGGPKWKNITNFSQY
jgi:hypothetical protein